MMKQDFARRTSVLMDNFEKLDLDIFALEAEIGKIKSLQVIASRCMHHYKLGVDLSIDDNVFST